MGHGMHCGCCLGQFSEATHLDVLDVVYEVASECGVGRGGFVLHAGK
jgi:hypothetical protein